MTKPPTTQTPPVLDARAATKCARKAHNDFDVTIPRVPYDRPIAPELQMIFDQGYEFEALVRAQLVELLGADCIDINMMELFGDPAVDATVAAMKAGMPVILGGWLPIDVSAGRSGRPDVLVRVSAPGDLDTRYVPVDIKGHKTLERARKSSAPIRLSTLAEPFPAAATEVPELTSRKQEADALQLAHYWRMLEACGHAPDGPAIGGIIGTDDFDGAVHVLWRELEVPEFSTFSRSAETGKNLRSAMERYDHEFAFRSEIATVASQRNGGQADPPPLVVPVRVKECPRCIWFDYCADFDSTDASFAVGDKLSPREWITLRNLGYRSVTEVASLDAAEILNGDSESSPTGRLLAEYLPEVANVATAKANLAKAVRTAQMVVDGVYLRRTTSGEIDVPRADIEVDFDIEFDTSPSVYLWGMFITDRLTGTSHYEDFSFWGEVDDNTEATLGIAVWERLQDLARAAAVNATSLRVYHYTSPETLHLQRVLGEEQRPAVDAFIKNHFVDLHPIVRQNFEGRNGLGLKQVATHGAGFSWRDEEPGGFQSMAWHQRAQTGDADAVTRVLQYNEDDVRATWAVREWLYSNPT